MGDFLNEVRRLEWAFADGLWAPAIVDHTNTRFDFAGANYAPFDDLINGYTIQFTGDAERVDLLGSNNDLIDVLIPTGVSIVPSNSAGLQIIETGSGLSAAQDMKLTEVHGQTLREVWIDEENIAAGNGYQQSPYNNWGAAIDYAEANDILNIVTHADATLDRNTKQFSIRGISFPTIDLNGQDVDGATVLNSTVTGIHLGTLLLQDCGMNDLSGEVVAQRVAAGGSYTLRGGSFSILTDVASLIPGVSWVIDFGVSDTPSILGLTNFTGSIEIDNLEAGDICHIHTSQSRIVLNASCTGGTVMIAGASELTDNSTGSTVDTAALIQTTYVNKKLLTKSFYIGTQ
jgi:hypothetical protein